MSSTLRVDPGVQRAGRQGACAGVLSRVRSEKWDVGKVQARPAPRTEGSGRKIKSDLWGVVALACASANEYVVRASAVLVVAKSAGSRTKSSRTSTERGHHHL